MFEDQTKDIILQRMLDAMRSDIDKREGSITWDMLSPSAIEMAMAYIQMDNILNLGFADTTYGDYLDRRAGELGLDRKASVQATGQVQFTGTNGTIIPVGTQVSTDGDSPILFATTVDGTVTNGVVTINAQSLEGGSNGNVAVGAIKLVVGNLSGVTGVTNPAAFENGADTESDAELLQRYYDRVQKPATSGNKSHYEMWAKEIAGVGGVKVYPLWNGNGTVKVLLIDTDGTAPSQELIDEVSSHIEDQRPIGATVTVAGATEVPIDVIATLTLDTGMAVEDVQTIIEDAIIDYLKSLAFVDPVVRYSRIANILLDTAGVIDYSGLTVNGGTANITIADGSVAVKGTVTLNVNA